jgi:transposase-like protein
LAVNSDQSISQTARELGVHETTLHGWVNRYYPKAKRLAKKATEDDSAEELRCLRRENARLKQERDILKKAAAFFASETS